MKEQKRLYLYKIKVRFIEDLNYQTATIIDAYSTLGIAINSAVKRVKLKGHDVTQNDIVSIELIEELNTEKESKNYYSSILKYSKN